ncbi:hypothetical protein XO12_10315 [Marinitoga sp. 1154]|nr:hypothetical protein [Marinitoga sp. 1154]NUV00463.1 hypothetical protein [Marinitoga sp. 1154]
MGKNFKNESLIINKIDEIEKNLQELEEIIKKEEFNPPEDIVPIPKKIKFPRGYFRKIDTIYSKYKLDLFDDKNLARNVAYAIQYTDFLNYILNRTNFGNDGLSIGSIFRKNAIISVTTVIEAYLSAMLEKVVNNCYSNCKNFSS